MLITPPNPAIVRSFLDDPSVNAMAGLVEFSKRFSLNPSDIAELAVGLAKSGTMLKIESAQEVYDVASTGGPGSLSTLLVPLVFCCLNKMVLKLTVPGRPAGAIDCLAQIEKYEVEPTSEILNRWLASGAYIHILANNRFTPLDIIFFNYRKDTNNLNIPSLVIASILSKKLALGVTHVGLDIRVSEFGNFGVDWDQARLHASLFNSVAKTLNLKSKCFISNGFYPQQPFWGRGESLLALRKIFLNHGVPPQLKNHAHKCYSMALSLAGEYRDISITAEKLEAAFKANLELQNSEYSYFLQLVDRIETDHKYELHARTSGFLKVRLRRMRDLIVETQRKFGGSMFPDPCGVILCTNSFDYLNNGDLICTYRCPQQFRAEFHKSLLQCFEMEATIHWPYELEEIG